MDQGEEGKRWETRLFDPLWLIPSPHPEPEKDSAVAEKVLDLQHPSGLPGISVTSHDPHVGDGDTALSHE